MTTQEFDKAVTAFVLAYRGKSLAEAFRAGRFDEEGKWITVNGTHVLLNEEGEAQSGGKLKGTSFTGAKSQNTGNSAKDLNKQVAAGRNMKTAEERKKLYENAVKSMPVGMSVKANGVVLTKLGDNKFKSLDTEIDFEEEVTEGTAMLWMKAQSRTDKPPVFKEGEKKQEPTKETPGKAEGMELYRKFVEGQSYEIHKALGVDMINGGKYDPDAVDKEAAEAIDSVFTPAPVGMTLYKGLPMTEEEIGNLKRGKAFQNHTISSTSEDTHAARSYADNAYDTEDGIPVFMKVKVEEGTPIVDARKLLGETGMKGFEKEITVGRDTEWQYGEVKNVGDEDDPYYEVEVTVKPSKKRRTDSAYDEWLEENLDKFEDDDAERDFAQWNGGGERPRDCTDVDEVERLWKEYNGEREDGGPGSGNFGHKGRPGEIGGSAPGKGGGTKEKGLSKEEKQEAMLADMLHPSKVKMNKQIADVLSEHKDDYGRAVGKIKDLLDTLEPGSKITVPPNDAGDEGYVLTKTEDGLWSSKSVGIYYWTSESVGWEFIVDDEKYRPYVSKSALSKKELSEYRSTKKSNNFRDKESPWADESTSLNQMFEVTLQQKDLEIAGDGLTATDADGTEYQCYGYGTWIKKGGDYSDRLTKSGAKVMGDYFDINCGLNGMEAKEVSSLRKICQDMAANEPDVWAVYEKTFRAHRVQTSGEGEGAYFRPLDSTVHLPRAAEANTFIHEMSHALDKGSVDLEYTGYGGYKFHITSASGNIDHLADPISKHWNEDFEAMAKIVGYKTNGKGWFENDGERDNAVEPFLKWSKQYNGMRGFDCVSDAISAMTQDYSGGSFFSGGHSRAYWQTPYGGDNASMQSKEYWANFCELKATKCDDALALLKSVSPNRFAAAEATYKEVFKSGKKASGK